jgi:hypothetical protein
LEQQVRPNLKLAYVNLAEEESDDLPPKAERRPKSRKRTLFGGLVSFSDGAECFDCRIRDLSDDGARITFPADRPVPTSIYLINVRDAVAHEATIVWRKGGEAGLKFRRKITLADLTDPKLGYLKRLWGTRALR